MFSQAASDNLHLVWGKETMDFTAIDTTTTLMFSAFDGTGYWGAFLDDVSVTQNIVTPTPEPAALSLLAAGMLGLLGWRRLK